MRRRDVTWGWILSVQWIGLRGRGSAWVVALLAMCSVGNAQGFFRDFHDRNTEVKAVQPTWVTPLVGTTPLLGQFVREEFARQKMPGGAAVWNIGNNKGLSLVLSRRVETDLSVPNYVVHGSAPGADGVGDFCFTTRVRIASGNRERGNYSVAAVLSQTWATGLEKNGAATWTRGITMAGGKAFGRFAALGSVGATIPADAGLATMGRPVAANSAFEMHAMPKLWAQVETNTTVYNGGTHDGKVQTFVTPGVFLVPLKLRRETSKSYVLVGVGMQFAVTHYHASDHNLVVDTKVYF
jgi:hypothetical protein